jgi:hypothetical protein
MAVSSRGERLEKQIPFGNDNQKDELPTAAMLFYTNAPLL